LVTTLIGFFLKTGSDSGYNEKKRFLRTGKNAVAGFKKRFFLLASLKAAKADGGSPSN
jgi:hypothetical protein